MGGPRYERIYRCFLLRILESNWRCYAIYDAYFPCQYSLSTHIHGQNEIVSFTDMMCSSGSTQTYQITIRIGYGVEMTYGSSKITTS